MQRVTLTDLLIRNLKPAATGKRYVVHDALLPEFGILVTDKGSKSFTVYKRWPGEKAPKRLKIGDANKMKLTDARKLARRRLEMAAEGVNYREEERKAAEERAKLAAHTFGAVATAWFAFIQKQDRRAADVEADVRREFFPLWKDRPIGEITPAEIAEVITTKAKGSGKVRPKPAMARNLLIHLKRLFRWAYDQHQEGRYGLAFSPAAQLSGKSLIGKKKARVRVLTDQELQRVYLAAASTDYLYPWGPLVRMLALTGQRLREVAEARWREFDFKNRTWTVPAVRMKGAKPHVVPIADDLLALLNDLPRFNRGDHLFSTTSGEKPVSGYANAKVRLDKLVGDVPSWVFHDVRRSVRTNLSAIKQVKKQVAERMIAHTQPGVEGVYDLHEYFDEKREGFALWENRLRSIVKSGEAET